MLKIIFGIIVGFVLAFFIIKNDGLKFLKTPAPITPVAVTPSPIVHDENVNLLSIEKAEKLVKDNWADIVVPKCAEGEEVCPHISVSVVNTKDARTNEEKTSMIYADVVGFADDSYAGERRQATVYYYNGNWTLGDPSEFKLCRQMQPFPKGATCP